MLHGHVTNLYVGEGSGVRKEPVPLLQIDETGIIGDKHAGLKKRRMAETRASNAEQ